MVEGDTMNQDNERKRIKDSMFESLYGQGILDFILAEKQASFELGRQSIPVEGHVSPEPGELKPGDVVRVTQGEHLGAIGIIAEYDSIDLFDVVLAGSHSEGAQYFHTRELERCRIEYSGSAEVHKRFELTERVRHSDGRIGIVTGHEYGPIENKTLVHFNGELATHSPVGAADLERI